MKETIDFAVGSEQYSIPNSWERLSASQYIALMHDIARMQSGLIPVALVRINHVCRCMGWNLSKIKAPDAKENLCMLSGKVTFPFIISYPDDDLALMDLSEENRMLCKRVSPDQLKLPIARYLAKQAYTYCIDSCFCAQLLPAISVGDKTYAGYTIQNEYGMLTTSLTALQYIEARDICTDTSKLPLLASILYHEGSYSSLEAHRLADSFATLPQDTLRAIQLNFIAFNNYLMTRTHYKLLTEISSESKAVISTGAIESLYALSADGYGDINTIEQINLITYLTILRKKIISVVLTMHSSQTKLSDIMSQTGLPYHIINQIIA